MAREKRKFYVKPYQNAKDEKRMQISGAQADFEAAASDKTVLNELVKSIRDATAKK